MSDNTNNNVGIEMDVVVNGVFISILSLGAYGFATQVNDVLWPILPALIGIVVMISGYIFTSRQLATSLLLSSQALRAASKITTLIFYLLPPLFIVAAIFLWFTPRFPHNARFSGGFYLMVGQLVWGVIFEEIFFRGILLPFLLQRIAAWKALVINAALFSVAHMFMPAGIGELRWLLLFIMGISLGLLLMRTGSLWTVIFAHLIWNSAMLVLTAYPPISITGNTYTTISMSWLVVASCISWSALAVILLTIRPRHTPNFN
jgi:membrane protease YdiL (CAAX protease family)